MALPSVRCPRCRGYLVRASCAACGADWTGPLGILDLSDRQESDDITLELLSRAETDSLEELLGWYEPTMQKGRSAGSARVNQRYASEATARSTAMIDSFSVVAEQACGRPLRGEVALDLGCGMGGSLVALASRFEHVIGVEPGLRPLVFAVARLRDLGIDNVTLIRGTGQALPLESESLDAVVALNVLEHLVDDLDAALAEVGRTLRRHGVLCADSRNRYDLFFHEPHVHLRFVGCLPRPIQAPYVKWRTGRAYAGTRLLSPFEARAKLGQHVGRVRATLGKPSAFGKPAQADALVALVDRVPVLSSVAQALYPSLLLVAERNAGTNG